MRELRPGSGEVRVDLDGALQQLDGPFSFGRVLQTCMKLGAEVVVVSLGWHWTGGELGLTLWPQLGMQICRDLFRDLVLHSKNICWANGERTTPNRSAILRTK